MKAHDETAARVTFACRDYQHGTDKLQSWERTPHLWAVRSCKVTRLVLDYRCGILCPMSEATHPRSITRRESLDEELRRHTPLLKEMARRYIWWMTPEDAIEFPARIVAQVMNIGVFRDASRMADALGDDCLRTVLQHAEAGQFNERSWHYWHYRLGLAKVDEVPPLPVRRFE